MIGPKRMVLRRGNWGPWVLLCRKFQEDVTRKQNSPVIQGLIDTSRIKLGADPVPALNTLLGMGAVGQTRIQMGSLQPSVDSDSSGGSGVSKALRTQPTHQQARGEAAGFCPLIRWDRVVWKWTNTDCLCMSQSGSAEGRTDKLEFLWQRWHGPVN